LCDPSGSSVRKAVFVVTTARVVSIMVVDDTLENLRLLSSMLGEEGYEVRPVTSGRQAVQAARSDPPDVILLDINMPEMNGYETCEALRQIDGLAGVPVIFLTALNSTSDKVKAFDVGGVDYITKPFQVEEVLARVRTHAALRRAREELSRNYDRLRALEELRENLVHMIVHDMRSPLMSLISHLGMLHDDHPAGGEAASDLLAAIQAAEAIRGMANDLLDVSRLEAGEMPLVRGDCDVVALVRDVRDAIAGQDRGRPIEIASPDPVVASCDAKIVYRVVENLVGNAIKHTPAGGGIRISVAAVGDRVRVEVADQGPGVPLEARGRIFEKFGAVTARNDHSYHSVGLGLAFCKLAVEAHRGAIGVADGEPSGSVFWFELPA
jgi:signal transduction histidine kinase